jgi:hypothetical protein
MRVKRWITVSLAVAFLTCTPISAPAAIVNPGQTVSLGISGDDFVPPTGDLVGENTQDFAVNYDLTGTGYTPSGPTSFTVRLTSQVVRDPATGRLTFVYRIETDGEAQDWMVGSERSTFAINSFAGFTTNVEMIKGALDLIVTRSADGATIDADTVDVGGSALPWAIIATDATEFDNNGTFSGTLGTELSITTQKESSHSSRPRASRSL